MVDVAARRDVVDVAASRDVIYVAASRNLVDVAARMDVVDVEASRNLVDIGTFLSSRSQLLPDKTYVINLETNAIFMRHYEMKHIKLNSMVIFISRTKIIQLQSREFDLIKFAAYL